MNLYHQDGTRRVLNRSLPLDYRDSVLHDLTDRANNYLPASLTPIRYEYTPTPPEERQKGRMKLFTAVADYKKHFGTADHNDQRNEFIKAFMSARLPNWGEGRVSFKGLSVKL